MYYSRNGDLISSERLGLAGAPMKVIVAFQYILHEYIHFGTKFEPYETYKICRRFVERRVGVDPQCGSILLRWLQESLRRTT